MTIQTLPVERPASETLILPTIHPIKTPSGHSPIILEVMGNQAIFTTLDSGAGQTSYRIPTWSAAEALYRRIASMNGAGIHFNPLGGYICSPIQFEDWTFNYTGPLRKLSATPPKAWKEAHQNELIINPAGVPGDSQQMKYRILTYVHYILMADVSGDPKMVSKLLSIFSKRLRKQSFPKGIPYLGISEFGVSYCGPLQRGTKIQKDENFTEVNVLRSPFDGMNNLKTSYYPKVEVVDGFFQYPDKYEVL